MQVRRAYRDVQRHRRGNGQGGDRVLRPPGFVVAAWLTNDDLGDAVGDDDAPYGM